MNNNHILCCKNLTKVYKQDDNSLVILDSINFAVDTGETISIVGSSGSGKSTLLHLLAGLDKPTSGDIFINNTLINNLNDNKLCAIRNMNLGFIYQFHHLLPEFTALENVTMPLIIGGYKIDKALKSRAVDILKVLGLGSRLNHYPAQLSGGERQRVAIARAVINNPKLVFADEPTGNLDNQTSNQVLEIFFQLQKELKTSLVIVTHDLTIAQKTQKQYQLYNGQLKQI